ncbi:hypothetical protein J5N97_012713 [Dioscorea zingiberensis]|uniref:Uncharacterized protein n=1 Tax=Dioscorea zingiberensis TaxID=325984 RepID=A0A9D5HI22_9LILI|nr:hypothetical protein J5N97_012713 [Dioscorea zingiberensis]
MASNNSMKEPVFHAKLSRDIIHDGSGSRHVLLRDNQLHHRLHRLSDPEHHAPSPQPIFLRDEAVCWPRMDLEERFHGVSKRAVQICRYPAVSARKSEKIMEVRRDPVLRPLQWW